MPRFIVHCTETVHSVYEVIADDEADARACCSFPVDTDATSQLEYTPVDVAVRSITPPEQVCPVCLTTTCTKSGFACPQHP